jgi:hypothetical protein
VFVNFALTRSWISIFEDWPNLFPISSSLLFSWLDSIASFQSSSVYLPNELSAYLRDIKTMQLSLSSSDLLFVQDASKDKINETILRLEWMANLSKQEMQEVRLYSYERMRRK